MKSCYTIRLGKCHIAICDLVPGEDAGLAIECQWITRVNVPKQWRGKGYGTKLLRQVLADADAEQVQLYLEPAASSGNLNQRNLVVWYKRHGFVRLKGMRGAMLRKPRDLPAP